jgi:hypothetical protein
MVWMSCSPQCGSMATTMEHHNHPPIGTPGQAWGPSEIAHWRARQTRQRSHADDVLAPLARLPGTMERVPYGEVVHGDERLSLMAVRPSSWHPGLPAMLVTGGVHGYETSGVLGALQWLRLHGQEWAGRANVLVVPCVSPWAWERIHRWNHDAIDPNRAFRTPSPAPESAALMQLVAQVAGPWTVHIDLHETTDSDETEFRPALAARDGQPFVAGHIPDGFYLVDDTENPQPAFQRAIIDAVEQVTHIAPADARGEIIGTPVCDHGVIRYPLKALGLCAGITGARYTTTTEVYPDSPRATPQQCVAAQVAAVQAAIGFALA